MCTPSPGRENNLWELGQKIYNTIHVIVVVDLDGTKPSKTDVNGLVGVWRAVGGGSQLCERWKKQKVFYLLE